MTAKAENKQARREFRGTGLYWSLFLGLIVAVAILIGIIQNAQSVQLKYLVWNLTTPLIVVLLVTIFASVLLSAFVGLAWRHRRRQQLTDREELRGLRGRTPDTASTTSETSTLEQGPPHS